MPKLIHKLPENTVYTTMPSPVGELTICADDKNLLSVIFETTQEEDGFADGIDQLKRADRHPILLETKKQLREYFKGARTKFELPLKFLGTDFQVSVWKQLIKVPFAKTHSYSQQAARVGDVRKVRAVAGANGKNPISIIAPCHRIIGKDGSLTGFGGGLDAKRWLLDHEASVAAALKG